MILAMSNYMHVKIRMRVWYAYVTWISRTSRPDVRKTSGSLSGYTCFTLVVSPKVLVLMLILLCLWRYPWLQTRTRREIFAILSGPCTSADGCIQSPNHPNKYGNSEFCQIVAPAKPLFITHFETGAGNDNLTINGHVYSGSSAPPQGIITSDTIQWQSGDATTASGWRICTSFGLKLGLWLFYYKQAACFSE